LPDKGQKAHESRSFHGLRQNPLVLGAGSGMFRIDDFRLARDKPSQKLDVFIIDVGHILGTKKTLPFHGVKKLKW